MSVKSMTGYGRASGIFEGKEINIDIKSVNHRYFEFNSRVPKDYLFLENNLKSKVNSEISRGKIDLFLHVIDNSDCEYEIETNKNIASAYASAFKFLSKSLKIKNDLTVSFLAKISDVIKLKKKETDESKIEMYINEVLDKAIESYHQFRVKEGKKLYDYIMENLEIILQTVEKIEILAPESIKSYSDRLRAKMSEVLEGNTYDEQRLITEVALFADKVDVGEETVRLRSHISQFKDLMNSNAKAIGKNLDFYIQEMNREVNTIGSKCNSIEITQLVVNTKTVIEKIREQIQNLE